ncbi:MAG: AbrB/MazE/SpoVT family DNA-binding domain-containing protein [Dehalococcoidia bacterium]
MSEVKNPTRRRRAGVTRISTKNQVTIPVSVLRASGLRAGDSVTVTVDGAGKLRLEAERDPLEEFAGCLTGVYEPGELDRLRDEWD